MYRGTYFTSDHRSARHETVSKPLNQEEKSMSKSTKSRTVTFTSTSENSTGVTVTATRLEQAGFKINANTVLKGQRFRATLTDARGNTLNVTLTVNRAKTNGSSQTTLYSGALNLTGGFVLPYVGVSRDYTVVNFRAL
jgi:hypothetical protein